MKKLLFAIAILLFSGALFSQVEWEPDTIIRLGGRKMIVDVKTVGMSDVSYKYKDEEETKKIERKQIQEIHYSSGRVEKFNKPIFIALDETNWEAILVTDNKAEVEGLFMGDSITAKSSPSSRSRKAAKKSATIRLQKRTANRGGNIVYVYHQEFRGGYGDPPGYYMEGIVYSFEPFKEDDEEGEN